MVLADWFDSPPQAEQLHPFLHVPVIKSGFLDRRALGTGNLWSVSNIVPIHITLMRNLARSSATAAAKTKANQQLVVLSRDASLTQLAHPAWGPNAHFGASLTGDKFRILRRMSDNANVALEQEMDQAMRAPDVLETEVEGVEVDDNVQVVLNDEAKSSGTDEEDEEEDAEGDGEEPLMGSSSGSEEELAIAPIVAHRMATRSMRVRDPRS